MTDRTTCPSCGLLDGHKMSCRAKEEAMSATIYQDDEIRVLYKETGILGEPYGIRIDITGDQGRDSQALLTKSEAIKVARAILASYGELDGSEEG